MFPTALGIPDNTPTGVTDAPASSPTTVEIADLDFRVDNLTHTFAGDVTVMLRAPNGYGTDFIWLPGIILGDGRRRQLRQHGDRRCGGRRSVDRAERRGAVHRIVEAGVQLAVVGRSAIRRSSRIRSASSRGYNGMSSAGTWTLLVADNFAADTGTLNGWSLIVTPRTFACSAFVDPPPMTIDPR